MRRGDEDRGGTGIDHDENEGRARGNMAMKKGFRLLAGKSIRWSNNEGAVRQYNGEAITC